MKGKSINVGFQRLPPTPLPLLESGLMNDKVDLEDNSVCSESIAARWIAPAV